MDMHEPNITVSPSLVEVLRSPRLVIFAAGFFLMTVEVLSGRVLAPYLGVSIYTWTSVIGVTLAGVAIGNALGGRLADRRLSRTNLGICFAAAGVFTLLANILIPELGSIVGGRGGLIPLWLRAVLFSVGVFFPTALCLSTVSPQVMAFRVREMGTAGRMIGSVAAWGAAGNILGTFLAGYWFIALLGTKLLLTVIALALMSLGLWIAHPEPIWKHRWSILVLLILVGSLVRPNPCRMETNYYCIQVTDTVEAETHAYTLRLDHLVHSFVRPQNPAVMGYDYEEVYANVIALRYHEQDAFSTLFIGGGGYTMPRYLEAFYPSSHNTVAEIDPGVTLANHRLMELSDATRIVTENQDARVYLGRLPAETKFDLVFGDAFNDFSVPYHLTTIEFHRLLKSHMPSDGIYAMNIIDDARYGQFLSSMIRTLRSVWTYVSVAPIGSEIQPGRKTYVLLASDKPMDLEAWDDVRSRVLEQKPGADPKNLLLLTDEQVEAFLIGHETPALRDDFAPTDRYLSPVFVDAF